MVTEDPSGRDTGPLGSRGGHATVLMATDKCAEQQPRYFIYIRDSCSWLQMLGSQTEAHLNKIQKGMYKKVKVEQARLSPVSVSLQFFHTQQSPNTPILSGDAGQVGHTLWDRCIHISRVQSFITITIGEHVPDQDHSQPNTQLFCVSNSSGRCLS